MNPLSIKGILGAYTNRFRAPQQHIVQAVVVAYSEEGLCCTVADVAYTPHTKLVTVRAHGPQRTEMLLRKQNVLTRLRTTLSERDVPHDIV
jgi:hypothetical protein